MLLRLWVLLRLPLLLLAAVVAANTVGDALAHRLITAAYPHGAAKLVVESWQILLYRQRELAAVALAAGLAAALLSRLDGRRWAAGAALVVGLTLALAPWHAPFPLLLGLGLVLLAGASAQELGAAAAKARVAAWVPFTELLLPSVVSAGLGWAGRRRHLAVVFAGGAALGVGWVAADSVSSYEHYKKAMAAWPDALHDPRLVVMDRMPEWARADFHGVDIVGDHALVICEDRTELRAYPLDGGPATASFDLEERWDGVVRAATLDSETDPATGLTWLLDGPDKVQELRWTGSSFKRLHTERFPFHLQYVYTRWDPQRNRIILGAVQANARAPRMVALVGVPGLTWGYVKELRAAEGPVPIPREIAWIPDINQLVIAPDFGTHLWLADVDQGYARPWLEVPTLDGKMRWVPELRRLFLAIPNRPELWVIDPVLGKVERTIRTQPGVRSVAVDPERRLLVTASVVTGAVMVQDLDSGEIIDVFRTVMPMVRELALSVERGEAVLSTWSVLYRIPYAEKAGR
ncbi:MAG: hypothetical protein H6739_07895 [Alphaproteobacteria bacterium]|nr:hypothetical protein [Alphaproteobacteria bacterium]